MSCWCCATSNKRAEILPLGLLVPTPGSGPRWRDLPQGPRRSHHSVRVSDLASRSLGSHLLTHLLPQCLSMTQRPCHQWDRAGASWELQDEVPRGRSDSGTAVQSHWSCHPNLGQGSWLWGWQPILGQGHLDQNLLGVRGQREARPHPHCPGETGTLPAGPRSPAERWALRLPVEPSRKLPPNDSLLNGPEYPHDLAGAVMTSARGQRLVHVFS